MILPGISGSFILLLLGKYEFALSAVNSFDIKGLILLGAGAVIGLLSLSRLLSWLFRKYHDVTVALLAGFMIGSLNKIWPWKETLEVVIIEGHEKPLLQKNILPQIGSETDMLIPAILLMIAGGGLILLFELGFGRTKKATA
jgi:putative membrane protein